MVRRRDYVFTVLATGGLLSWSLTAHVWQGWWLGLGIVLGLFYAILIVRNAPR